MRAPAAYDIIPISSYSRPTDRTWPYLFFDRTLFAAELMEPIFNPLGEPRRTSDRLSDGLCLGFAAWTLLCHLVVALDGGTYLLLGVALPTLLVVGWWALRRRRRTRAMAMARPPERFLWAMVLLAIAVTLGVQRPDADDSFYLNLAANVADRPAQPLLCCDTLVGEEGLPIQHPTQRFQSLVVLSGALAFLTPIDAIVWSHLFIPALAALLVVLAHARLLRLLAPERWRWCLAAIMLVYLTVGDAHAWYSNLGFVRLHQGKAIFLSALVPLISAYALEMGRMPGRRVWLCLAASQVAAVGLTPTALWVAPAVSGLALLAAFVPSRRGLEGLLLGGLSSFYPLLAALGVRPEMIEALQQGLELRSAETLIARAASYVLGDGWLPWVAVLASALAWWTCARGLARRFCLVVPLVFLLIFFNPFLARWMAGNVTGVFTYWRVFWLVPIPIFIALCLTLPLGPRGQRWPRLVQWGTSLVLMGLFVCLVPQVWVLGKANRVRVAPFALKVPPPYEAAAALVRRVPPGAVVVAPLSVAAWTTTFHHHPYPVVARLQYLRPELGAMNIYHRSTMMAFVSGPVAPENVSLAAFFSLLELYEVRGAVLRRSLPWRQDLVAGLEARGWIRQEEVGRFEIWTRPWALLWDSFESGDIASWGEHGGRLVIFADDFESGDPEQWLWAEWSSELERTQPVPEDIRRTPPWRPLTER